MLMFDESISEAFRKVGRACRVKNINTRSFLVSRTFYPRRVSLRPSDLLNALHTSIRIPEQTRCVYAFPLSLSST